MDKYYEMTFQLQGASFLWDEIREFAICTDSDIPTLPIKPYSLSRKDLLDLTHDFFKDILGYHKMAALKVAMHVKYSKSAQNAARLMGVVDCEINEPFKSNKDLRKCARNHGIADLDNALDSFAVTPLIDYMFAIEFYSLYKEDKDRALNALKSFITTNCGSKQDYLTILKKLGICLNKSAHSYNRDCLMLSRELKSHR